LDAGSCNGCDLEIHALKNVIYDLVAIRFTLCRFAASRRRALLVTGPVTTNMREALERTYQATPGPKWVLAIGDCARDGGVFSGSYAGVGGVSAVLSVDIHIRDCPPLLGHAAQGPACIAGTVQQGGNMSIAAGWTAGRRFRPKSGPNVR
jgi:Ni,Fe-hydrogenase III small subunit